MKRLLVTTLLTLGVLSLTGCYESTSSANTTAKTTKSKCGATGKCGNSQKAATKKCGATMKCGAGKCGTSK